MAVNSSQTIYISSSVNLADEWQREYRALDRLIPANEIFFDVDNNSARYFKSAAAFRTSEVV